MRLSVDYGFSEDAESGIELEHPDKRLGGDGMHLAGQHMSSDGKQGLPKGSTTFQQVLDEIKQEKETEHKLVEKTIDAFMGVRRKRNDSETQKEIAPPGSKWRVASMQMLTRRRSRRDSIVKMQNP